MPNAQFLVIYYHRVTLFFSTNV